MKLWTAALPAIAALAFCAGTAVAQTQTDQSHTDHQPKPGVIAAPEADPNNQTQLQNSPKGQRMPGNKEAYLYIGWPNNGEVVNSRFKVWFGLRNFGVAPAGVRKEKTGHHHLLVDTDLKNLDEPIPTDKNHLHFGKGQTETYLELPPGRHTLQLVLADDEHIPHDPPIMSKKITITVRPEKAGAQISSR